MGSFLKRPEWAYIVAYLSEAETDAVTALMQADPNDPAKVMEAQADARTLFFITSGQLADAVKAEIQERQEKND